MSFSFDWTDFPEEADNDDFVKNCFLECGDFSWKDLIEHSQYSFISGDNYPVLRLLENHFSSKINFMYIDPPYNTGKKTFTYNDAFPLNKKSACTPPDRHSAWLSFMSRRLASAKKLLSDSGCIFLAIGQEELYHLKLLCDKIFGEENFVNDFMWLHGKGKKDSFSRTLQESTLCYAKNKKKLSAFRDFEETSWAKENPDGDLRGAWFSGSISFSEKRSNPLHPNYFEIVSPSGKKWKRQWLVKKEEMQKLLQEDRIFWGKAPDFANVPRKKIFNGERTEIIPKNIIDEKGGTRSAQRHLDFLIGEKSSFDNPKPVTLIQHFLSIVNMKNDITVMDFFAGSGTTMEAVFNANLLDGGKRKCILIQKPEAIKSGKSRFSDISELCLERVRKITKNNVSELKLVVP